MTASPLDRPVTPFPRLRPPLHLAGETTTWYYPSATRSGGAARLQVWATLRGHLAVITHQAGSTPSDAPQQVSKALRSLFGEGDLVIIEHVPADEDSFSPEHWNQLTVTPDNRDHWRRVWPVPVTNPNHGPFSAWARASGTMIGIPPAARP